MTKKLFTALAAALSLGASAWGQDVGSLPKADPPVYALKGAMVHTVAGPPLENATVIVRDGLIEAVGVGIPTPADAREIDFSGLHLYPGLIDALTENGLKREKRPDQQQGRQRQRRRRPSQPADEGHTEGPGLYTYRHAADAMDPDAATKLASWRENGILTVHVAPEKGIFRGQTAVINLSETDVDHMILSSPVAMAMNYSGLSGRTYPGSLMGVIAHMKQTFIDANHYREAWAIYSQNPSGLKRPETDRALSALQGVIEGEMPAIFPAQRVRQIRRALKMADEFGIRPVIAGGFEADQISDELKAKDVPVLFSLKFPTKPKDAHPDFNESLAAIKHRVNVPRVPAKLQEAGVRFAFSSGGSRNAGDFMKGLRKVAEEGLAKEDALRAATLSAARILGVDRQLGSIETGKIANLVVTDVDIFDSKAQVRHVFVDGAKIDFPVKEKKDSKDPAEVGDEGGSVDGLWEVVVTTPQGSQDLQFDLTDDDGELTGSVISSFLGTLEVLEGSTEGSDFRFKVVADLGQGPTDIIFSGSVQGDSMTGSADVSGLGAASIEGTRVPK